MKKIVFLVLMSVVIFFVQFFIFNWTGHRVVLSLSIVLILFADILFGFRHGVITALICGMMAGSYLPSAGSHTIVLCGCAVFGDYIKRFVYQKGHLVSLMVLVFSVLVFQWILSAVFQSADGISGFFPPSKGAFFFDLAITTFSTSILFKFFIRCASRLYISA